MVVAVHQPQYLPWLGYFDKIAACDAFVFLDCVQYKPREFQNRNKVRTPEGSKWLSVPVVSKDRGRQIVSEVEIDNDFPWKRQHLNALRSAYGKAAYFDRYAGFFQELYSGEWNKLMELNVHIIKYLLAELGIARPVYFESALGICGTATERIIEICQKLNADTYLSGAGGKDYLAEEKFVPAGIKLLYQEFKHPRYAQQFMKDENDFIPNLSVLDLLFNEGPNSSKILNLDNKPNT